MDAEKRPFWKRWLRIATGILMLLVGVAGLILPVLPGWVFVIPGLALLGKDFPWARRVLRWIRRNFQTAVDKVEKSSRSSVRKPPES